MLETELGIGRDALETEIGRGKVTVGELTVIDDSGVGVSDGVLSSKEDGGREMRAGSRGGIQPMSRSEMLGFVAGDGGIISSTTEDATDRGRGISSGCIEQISAVVYSVDSSLGQISAVSYSDPTSALLQLCHTPIRTEL
jgi:hypothetical protein